ncbi:uncharacterized protein LOC131658065 [Vicia villosa]|uniref:uncharacterized protein LOC131658065 n=1 Tax=Vicia villosa TaxID=3911 RepID=UPI00273ADE6B|nr:uncharacterized protein LOC131658065 [Vicia villosa]
MGACLVYLYAKLSEGCMWKTKHVTGSITLLTHFAHISGWPLEPTYIEDKPRASAFSPLRGNQAIEPFRVYIDRLVFEDIQFHCYIDHHETIPFNDIDLYLGWLACRSRLTALHLPERVMRQLGYMQFIPKDPFVSTPLTVKHEDMNVMFDYYVNHLVPDEPQNTIAPND